MSTTTSIISIDAGVLASYYAAKAGVGSPSAGSASTSAATTATPPWSAGTTAAPLSALVKSVLAGGKYIDAGSHTIGTTTASTSSDAKNLFALYQGLTALEGVAEQAQTKGLSSYQASAYQASFASGLTQLQTFLAADPLKNATVVQDAATATAQSKVGVKTETDAYTGGTIYTGPLDGAVPALQGDVAFSLNVTPYGGSAQTVNFDLSALGDTTRSIPNVVDYLNSQLAAAGVQTKFAYSRIPATGQTVTVADGTTKTLPPPTDDDSYALKLVGKSTEQVSFSAPATTPAVYVTQSSGAGTDTVQQLVKLNGDPSNTGPAAVFGETLPSSVTSVRSTVTGGDGSVYVLADIDGATPDGQTASASGDVALLKYDSAGSLQYTRTLGSASAAQGFSLAVSADGSQVAVAGAVTGNLDKLNPAIDPTQPNTFVSAFNAQGVEQWTQLAQGGAGDQPSAVTFGPDGSVYVTGKTSGAVQGSSSQGGEDAFVLGFDPTGLPTLATQFGTGGYDKGAGVVATASGVTVASIEDGHAVLRQFAAGATGDAQPTAVRDLGDLQGGDIAGLTTAADGSLVLAGSTHNGALSAGTVTQAYDGGGQDVFVAKLSPDLSGASDSLSYWNGGADASTSGVTVSGGQVYVTGSLQGAPAPGYTTPSQTGYAVAIDPDTGLATWEDSLGGRDGQSRPTGIAVDPQGASVLDTLGLPAGKIDYTSPADLVSNTSLRPGDQFQVKVGTQPAVTVTIAQGETLDTLAQKINRASGFQATATTVTVDGYRQLNIAPANARTSLQLLSGPAGTDALVPLGLTEGTVTAAATASAKPVSKGIGTGKTISVAKPYSLGLPTTLSVATAAGAKNAQTLLATALTTVRKAYSDLTTPPTTASSSEAVPAYLTAQIANYQLALSRLTGSS